MKSIVSRLFCFLVMVACSHLAFAQVPVFEEPVHRVSLKNKYVRLLDVWLPAGDTTQYHIHATPSVFVTLSSNLTATQVRGEQWTSDRGAAGKIWYRSFSPDVLVHRVSNLDTLPFHVNDIELLSAYQPDGNRKPLNFPVFLENEKVILWQVTDATGLGSTIEGRGPIIAELIKGKTLVFQDGVNNRSRELKQGGYLYIEPLSSFKITGGEPGMNLVLIEIK